MGELLRLPPSAGKKVSDITLDLAGRGLGRQTWALVWIGLEEPSAQELNNLQRQFNLHELAIEDAIQPPEAGTFGDARCPSSPTTGARNASWSLSRPTSLPATAIITARNGHWRPTACAPAL